MALYEHVEIDLKRKITVFKFAIHYEAYASGKKHLELRRSTEIITGLRRSTEILKFIKEI